MNNQEKDKRTDYCFPPLNLLKKGEYKEEKTIILKETALRLLQILEIFGVYTTITDIIQGPFNIRFEIKLAQGTKVSKVIKLEDEIKLNLVAEYVHIDISNCSQGTIGIEISKKEKRIVQLRSLLETDTFQSFPSNLAFAVGEDITGQKIVMDIAKMNHILIGGTTGSGKTVCIDSIIMSILYKAAPSDVKMIMIDTKLVNMSVYNGIPHLIIPVITDTKKASAALNWCVAK